MYSVFTFEGRKFIFIECHEKKKDFSFLSKENLCARGKKERKVNVKIN